MPANDHSPVSPNPIRQPFWSYETSRVDLSDVAISATRCLLLRRHCTSCGSGTLTRRSSRVKQDVYTFSVIMRGSIQPSRNWTVCVAYVDLDEAFA